MSVDKASGLSLKEGPDYPCAERQAPSIFYSLYFMLLCAEKLGWWLLRTKAVPGVGRLGSLTVGDTLMVPMKDPIVRSQFLPPDKDEAPCWGAGQQPSPSLASKPKLALNLCKGIESRCGPSFWSLLKRGVYSLALAEVAEQRLKINCENKILKFWKPGSQRITCTRSCLRMGKIKATLKQVKPISTANSKDMANNLFIKCQPWFSLPCR